MNNDLSSAEIRIFYEKLQVKLVDNRSHVGRKHELAFVITLFIISILTSSDHLSINKIHRNMVRYYEKLCICLHKDVDHCISRVQLTRILSEFDYESFLTICDEVYSSTEWISIDGKELRGSIDSKSNKKRGLSIVYSIGHNTNVQQLLGFYDGTKESEKSIVYDHILELPEQAKITLDAMHNSENLLSNIHQNSRFYLTQIKSNQKKLKDDLVHTSNHIKVGDVMTETDKSHGRIDIRKYEIFPINTEMLEPRWSNSGICNMIKVTRESHNVKRGRRSTETRYYITNYNGEIGEIAGAIRGHWKIEIMNRIRDVNFGEDKLKSLDHGLQKSISSVMLFICSGLMKINSYNNLNILREELVRNTDKIHDFFAA
ncbi:ISAs1 family transposase [Halosquirtibacter laminarini]|uniref:ISAs1 family transposase n=1 Tax=Halosquirtibacter laminarini TaxID=3374600 RepID=A0AC61NRA9_9BACT|nr:ISAs1 family transposase [Prolixibacteraceae bacterium]